jgi:pyruvate formate lyase activating enzyme
MISENEVLDVREPPGKAMGKVAELWKPVEGTNKIMCTACARYCKIGEGQVGLCGIRGVHEGKLWLYVYGRVITGHVDPIEKKPVSHYRPGSKIFSIATTGCNWLCHPAGTPILMADGTSRPVESIRPADRLWSYNVDGGYQIVPSVVSHVGTRLDWIYRLRYGSRGSVEFEATASHPVLTERGWILLKNLRPGDRILKVWYQNTRAWKKNRAAAVAHADFTCGVCGEIVKGLLAWNQHRGECYTRGAVFTAEQRMVRSERMQKRNPMRDPEVARRALATSKARYLVDPTHGWHRNLERLDAWRHRHPSEGQRKLYSILDRLQVNYEREFRIHPEHRLAGSKKFYVADAALPDQRLDIEVDGFWHAESPEVKRSDRIRDLTLEENGWRVLRIWSRDLFAHEDSTVDLIREAISPVLRTNKKMWLPVHSVTTTDRFESVYSFECISSHNYVADGVVVHNCRYCQNADISQRRKVEGIEVEPQDVVRMTLEQGCQGLAYTYNQPTIFIEFARDIGMRARQAGLINIFVSNGYDTPETVAEMPKFLDCVTVDFKGSGETNFVRKYINIPNADPIFQTLLDTRDTKKIHIEITDLIVPQVGDDLGAARHLSKWVYDNLGPDTPIHFLRFHPDYKMMEFPWTPVETLEKHCAVAKEEGLKYAYIGNVPGHPLENTYCPGCGAIAIKRYGYDTTGWYLDKDNKCKKCGYKLAIFGRLEGTAKENRFYSVLYHR